MIRSNKKQQVYTVMYITRFDLMNNLEHMPLEVIIRANLKEFIHSYIETIGCRGTNSKHFTNTFLSPYQLQNKLVICHPHINHFIEINY